MKKKKFYKKLHITSDFKSLFLRIGITFCLIGVLLWNLNLAELYTKFISFDIVWTMLAFFTVFISILISAWKWSIILVVRGYPIKYFRLVRHYFVGLFFNNVLPSTVGGDAIRAWETTKDTGEAPEAIGSVVTERLIAGIALGMTALIGLPFVQFSSSLFILVISFLIIDLIFVGLFLVPKVAEGKVKKLFPIRFSKLHNAVSNTIIVVRSTIKDPILFIKIVFLSILFQIFVAIVNFYIFKAMNVEVSLAECIIFTPMIFTVTMLPISLSGLGVREASYWYFFSQVGVSQVDAIVASLAFFIIVGIASLPGAPLFVLKQKKNHKLMHQS
jgi:uncharacterized protein (TIRG00374 family)